MTVATCPLNGSLDVINEDKCLLVLFKRQMDHFSVIVITQELLKESCVVPDIENGFEEVFLIMRTEDVFGVHLNTRIGIFVVLNGAYFDWNVDLAENMS